MNIVIGLADADFGNIQMVDPDGHLRICVHQGFPDWWIDYWNTVSAGHGACGTSIALGERVIVEDIEQSPIFAGSPALEIQRKAGVRAVQSTPVLNQSGQVIAMLSTHYRSPHRPDAKTQGMLDLFALVVAALIEQQTEVSPVPENRFRTVVEDQTEVICRYLPDGTFAFVNDAFCRLFGKSADELIGQRWQPEVAHPDDVPMIEAKLREMTPENPVMVIENRVFVAGGEMRWMQFINRGFYDAAGNLKETQSVGRDITQLKQAEAALMKSEELNRKTLQALPAHIAVLDENGRIFATNDAWKAYAAQNGGADVESIDIGGNYFEVCRHAAADDDYAARTMAGIDAVMTGQQLQFSMEYPCPSPQEQQWYYMTVVRLGDTGESGAVIAHQNITDLKQAELRLRESDERLELALAGSGLVLWDWSIPERKVTAGKRWYGLLGYSDEELGNSEDTWMALINPKDLEGFTQKLSAHLQGETASFESEHQLRHKDGHWVSVEARGKVTLRDKDNAPLRMVGTILDISQRKLLKVEGIALLEQIESLIRNSTSRATIKAEEEEEEEEEEEDKAVASLTKRQRQILTMNATGMTSADIGKQLYLSTATVISHRRNLMAKLNLHSTAEVTRFAIAHGLLVTK